MMNDATTFEHLITSIEATNAELTRRAKLAVNTSLTLRNWLIGYYINEYEMHGSDRADYGDGLMREVASVLQGHGLKHCDQRALYRYRSFCLAYPEIVGTLSPLLPPGPLQVFASGAIKIVGTLSPKSKSEANQLLTSLSYSHFERLVALEEPIKREFYQASCLQAVWSVRELKRQIASLLFERTALSTNHEKLRALTAETAETEPAAIAIRDPYIFDFLGLRSFETMGESALEDELLDKLQDFLLELGHGFCFEARQKRILMGATHNFVDLVFYHRILKCHVLVELKVGPFTHEAIGQLNTYVSYYKANEMEPGDNPPIGLLLCTEKEQASVKYALAGISNQVFVSKYQTGLPSAAELEQAMRTMLNLC
jgi:predicted nuclease of restriction endonuclease-like (RecB) superfamily